MIMMKMAIMLIADIDNNDDIDDNGNNADC